MGRDGTRGVTIFGEGYGGYKREFIEVNHLLFFAINGKHFKLIKDNKFVIIRLENISNDRIDKFKLAIENIESQGLTIEVYDPYKEITTFEEGRKKAIEDLIKNGLSEAIQIIETLDVMDNPVITGLKINKLKGMGKKNFTNLKNSKQTKQVIKDNGQNR